MFKPQLLGIMKRYYGSAVFEGEEVSDAALTQLQDIRGEESRRIDAAKREFQMQYDELVFWRGDEIATINSNAARQIQDQYRQISNCYSLIAGIRSRVQSTINATRTQFFLQFLAHRTREENEAVARIQAEAAHQIQEQTYKIRNAYNDILHIKARQQQMIAKVHVDFEIEYNIRLTRKEKDIAWSHADATDKIAAVLARRYYLPVYMLRCAKGPCEFCRAKYGTTGTYEQLQKLGCIPPFHDDCRCWLEEIGYVVM